jgi:hypothetical protein
MDLKKMKHIPEGKKIEYFINAILKGGAGVAPVERTVEVQEVTPHGMVIFKAAQATVRFLQTILKAPVSLAQFVYHAVKESSELVVDSDSSASALSVPVVDRPEQLDLTAHENISTHIH